MSAIISVAFRFLARNPPCIAIAGAILMWMYAAILEASSLAGYHDLQSWAPVVLMAGVLLQVLWLMVFRRF